jgi:hypothetical protein
VASLRATLCPEPLTMTAPAYQQNQTGPLASEEPSCPKCGGRMWDNRLSKKNAKAPDYKCRSRSCDGVIWPPRREPRAVQSAPKAIGPEYGNLPGVPMATQQQPMSDAGRERLRRICEVQDQCFAHALELAKLSEKAEVPTTLEGLSALTAQALIQFFGDKR